MSKKEFQLRTDVVLCQKLLYVHKLRVLLGRYGASVPLVHGCEEGVHERLEDRLGRAIRVEERRPVQFLLLPLLLGRWGL